ncbi:DNA recombination protein RmuC [Cryomorphaceae bacterium]|nr:DNA recombination protein RmuC [Cryomorphaceae bacterium]
MEYGLLLAGVVLGVVIGYLLGKRNSHRAAGTISESDLDEKYVLRALYSTLEERLDEAQTERSKMENERLELSGQLAAKNQELLNLSERLRETKKEIEDLQERFKVEFKNVANELLEEKSKKFTEQNEKELDRILLPFKTRLKEFEEKVDKTYKENRDEQISLKTQIDGLQKLNQQMAKEALELTNALKGDSKSMGDWGEFQLTRLLEQAGLKENVHFQTQNSFADGEGHQKRPDFIVHLPEDKHLIIDAKVSLKAYEAYHSAETDADRSDALKRHLASIKAHIKGLGSKRYEDLYQIATPDYVMMYIPVEPAFLLALEQDEDGQLYAEALDKNVVLVSTSTLLATLRTVGYIWKQETQAKNVQEIADRGAKLYDKFVGFVESLTAIGQRLDQARVTYDKALGQLKDGPGNLIRQAEQLKGLGLKTNKSLPKGLKEHSEDE